MIESLIVGATTLAGSTSAVNYISEGDKAHPERVGQCLTTTVASSTSTTAIIQYQNAQYRRVIETYSYINSLSADEIASLCENLENKINELEIDNNDTNLPKVKKL